MRQTFEHLVDHLLQQGFFLEEAVEMLEKTLIARALDRTRGNCSAASKLLGIHRNTLQRKILEFKLERKAPQKVKSAKRVASAS